MPEKLREFLDTVADQIRWKRARKGLTEELAAHLLEQQEDYMAAGMDEESAAREAVRQMGDPVALGAELDRVHRLRPQWGLLIFAVFLLIAGALVNGVLFDPSAPLDNGIERIIAGAAVLLFGYALDVSVLGKRIRILFPLFLVGIMLLFLVTTQVNHGYWWVQQVMLLFPTLFAALIWSERGSGWRGVGLSLATAGAGLLVSGMIPSTFMCLLVFSTAMILGLLFAWQDWSGVGKKRGLWLTVSIGVLVLGTFLWQLQDRLRIALQPELDPLDDGYFGLAIRRALSCARWLGPAEIAGLEFETGASLDRIVPELFGDALLVNLICRFGWLPFAALMLAFAVFFLWAICKTIRLRHSLGKAVSAAVLTTLLTQCAAALLLTFGVPLTAAAFPLVVGNWASVLNMLLIGLMLSAFRDDSLPVSAAITEKAYRYKLTVKLEKI